VIAAFSSFVQTHHSVEARLKEPQRHIRLEQPGKSAVAEHSVDLGYHIQLLSPSPSLSPSHIGTDDQSASQSVLVSSSVWGS
jgi:hypothetical protein